METEYIREFVCLAEIGNYMRAADELYISQSSLSQHIKRLETDLNMPLFLRTTRKISLSEEGRMFLPYAKKFVELQQRFELEITQMRNVKKMVINVGSMPLTDLYGINQIFGNFSAMYPEYSLKIVEGRTEKLKLDLQQGIHDFVIQRSFDPSFGAGENMETHIFWEDVLGVAVSSDHPLAGRGGGKVRRV